ncbi:hypothetical protein K443DRAFT_676747 [Laccaria amethystina LaAM-08-1]|uniref:Uncharacterized protein n=1 Tax=Laccaria amethystina LaAM-08-1 TaxID=1095629 RepID=A0A0C9Y0B2_9AGAR|nr:hypothetical protein K443DRAFT_676747 [Laccaria amethystina LaAM-08-1]
MVPLLRTVMFAKHSSSPLFNTVLDNRRNNNFRKGTASDNVMPSIEVRTTLCISAPTPVRSTAGRIGGLG